MTLTGYFALSSVFAPVWLAKTVRLRKIIARKLMKIDTYSQQCKSSAVTLVSGTIRFVRSRVNARLEHFFLGCRKQLRKSKYRQTNTIAAVMFRDSSFCQHKVYAGTRRSSLERRHQTTVGSRVTRTCCDRMLKFSRCLRNKLTVLSNVGF